MARKRGSKRQGDGLGPFGTNRQIGTRFRIDPGDPVTIEETAVAGTVRQRRVGLIEQWRKDGAVTPALHEASLRFEVDFAQAGLRGSGRGILSERVGGSPEHRDGALLRVLEAKRRISLAMEAMGTTSGDVVWEVIGNERSMRDYCARRKSVGETLNVHEVKGRLLAGLDFLAGHYGCR